MRYVDGQLIEPGDTVQIDDVYRGSVLASMDTDRYLPGEEHWAYLACGIMVDTDFGGLVHFSPGNETEFRLVERSAVA